MTKPTTSVSLGHTHVAFESNYETSTHLMHARLQVRRFVRDGAQVVDIGIDVKETTKRTKTTRYLCNTMLLTPEQADMLIHAIKEVR